VLDYQSQNDLLNIDDKTVNPKYVHQSINVNSQIKAVYGGADFETAEWAANLSGTIMKEVTKMEKTDISRTGGETWENQRTVGALEENYINTNMVLTLPPRVCVFVQPRHLASICFNSFVPVKDMKALDGYLEHKDKAYNTPTTTTENDDQPEPENSGIDTIPEEFSQPKATDKPPVSQAKPRPDNTEQSAYQEQELSEEAIKKRERNRARKAKQKAKKSTENDNTEDAGQIDKPVVSQAKPDSKKEKDDNESKAVTVELSDDFTTDFGDLNLQSDEKTMSLLNGLDDDEDK
jgi:hypothetical protein